MLEKLEVELNKMNKKRYIPLAERLSNLGNIVYKLADDPKGKNDREYIALINGMEIALSIMEDRPYILKEMPSKRKLLMENIKKKLKGLQFSLFARKRVVTDGKKQN